VTINLAMRGVLNIMVVSVLIVDSVCDDTGKNFCFCCWKLTGLLLTTAQCEQLFR